MTSEPVALAFVECEMAGGMDSHRVPLGTNPLGHGAITCEPAPGALAGWVVTPKREGVASRRGSESL